MVRHRLKTVYSKLQLQDTRAPLFNTKSGCVLDAADVCAALHSVSGAFTVSIGVGGTVLHRRWYKPPAGFRHARGL